MAHDPFRARSKPEVNTEGLSPQAAESAEKVMPDSTGGTPDSTPGNHVPDQAPEQTGQTGQTGQGEQDKPAEKPTHTAEQPRRRKGKR